MSPRNPFDLGSQFPDPRPLADKLVKTALKEGKSQSMALAISLEACSIILANIVDIDDPYRRRDNYDKLLDHAKRHIGLGTMAHFQNRLQNYDKEKSENDKQTSKLLGKFFPGYE